MSAASLLDEAQAVLDSRKRTRTQPDVVLAGSGRARDGRAGSPSSPQSATRHGVNAKPSPASRWHADDPALMNRSEHATGRPVQACHHHAFQLAYCRRRRSA